MKLREVKIKNFRCLTDIAIPISDTTVLISENDCGKTAFLEALRIALPQSASGRYVPFNEYDYFMVKASDSPQTSDGIIIELWFKEDLPDEWPDSLAQALNEIIQTDPKMNLDSIGLRLSSKCDPITKEIISIWEFLSLDGQPLGGKGSSSYGSNLNKFLNYIHLFYLSALRDSNDEFSPRSQFWGKILRNLKISNEQMENLNTELTKLNDDLLRADPRLEKIRESLDKVKEIMTMPDSQITSIRALPLRAWDIMAKSEVAIKAYESEVEFPLSCHGQGIQSLAVLFLFQAYIDVFLKPIFQQETVAILALEEPEVHLHPQAIRALAANLNEVKSQKIIASHSPYFIQEIPFSQIRMLRRKGPLSKILYVKRSFSIKLQNNPNLQKFCENNSKKFNYNEYTSNFTIIGKMEKDEFRNLLSLYPNQNEVHAEIKRLNDESQFYLSDDELKDLDTYSKRIRGEIFFARAWLLCEGQSDYMLLQYFAELLGNPLDRSGITIIDFQNNGSPGAFVNLALTFEIPWIMVCDNDPEGKRFVEQVKKCGLADQTIEESIRPLPKDGEDLEMFLLNNGFMKEYIQILAEQKVILSLREGEKGFEDEIASMIKNDKTYNMIALICKLRMMGADKSRVPSFFEKTLNDIFLKALLK